MPLPDEPTLVEGGCNCGAVRYRVQIPAKHERPIYPFGGAGPDEAAEPDLRIRMPFACTDHCNDCRRATGALLPFWLLTPMAMVYISLVERSSQLSNGRLDTSVISKDPWRPAVDVFLAKDAVENTFLTFFASSSDRRRSFCSRCGTMFSFCAFPTPDWIEYPMLDLVLGTVDRDILDQGFLKPDRQLHWKAGINWVQEFSKSGLEVPIYSTSNVAAQISS